MIPDATKHNPDPEYLRGLISKVRVSQRKIAPIIGIYERTLRAYLAKRSSNSALDAPYPVQFCLEVLALSKQPTCAVCGYHGLDDWQDDGKTCPKCKLAM